jgi:hypothetical protein
LQLEITSAAVNILNITVAFSDELCLALVMGFFQEFLKNSDQLIEPDRFFQKSSCASRESIEPVLG